MMVSRANRDYCFVPQFVQNLESTLSLLPDSIQYFDSGFVEYSIFLENDDSVLLNISVIAPMGLKVSSISRKRYKKLIGLDVSSDWLCS
jgi:hypothetical protein